MTLDWPQPRKRSLQKIWASAKSSGAMPVASRLRRSHRSLMGRVVRGDMVAKFLWTKLPCACCLHSPKALQSRPSWLRQ
eukprot:5200097-Lingulodinium_polyedra.AAC.1